MDHVYDNDKQMDAEAGVTLHLKEGHRHGSSCSSSFFVSSKSSYCPVAGQICQDYSLVVESERLYSVHPNSKSPELRCDLDLVLNFRGLLAHL